MSYDLMIILNRLHLGQFSILIYCDLKINFKLDHFDNILVDLHQYKCASLVSKIFLGLKSITFWFKNDQNQFASNYCTLKCPYRNISSWKNCLRQLNECSASGCSVWVMEWNNCELIANIFYLDAKCSFSLKHSLSTYVKCKTKASKLYLVLHKVTFFCLPNVYFLFVEQLTKLVQVLNSNGIKQKQWFGQVRSGQVSNK